MTKKPTKPDISLDEHYDSILGDIAKVIDDARRSSARSVNSIMTAAYWLIGRRIVEFKQSGESRAEYGTSLLRRLSADLTTRFGRGFSVDNLESTLSHVSWGATNCPGCHGSPSKVRAPVSHQQKGRHSANHERKIRCRTVWKAADGT
jgi:DUF1016 N-terminal domain